jgi:hypothetical protein
VNAGMDPHLDPDLAPRFEALRRQEEGAAPAFAHLWGAAERRRREGRSATFHRGAMALAAISIAAVALLSAWLVALRVPAPTASLGAVPSISEWRSPTAFLLRTPGQEILEQPPALGRGFAIETSPALRSTSTDRRSS